MTPDFLATAKRVLAAYDDWNDEREDIAERESNGDYPHPDEWYGSDDDAVDLLHSVADLLRELVEIEDRVNDPRLP